MADEHRPRQRYGEEFWRIHHEARKRSDLNQRQYCEAQGIPPKALAIGEPYSKPSRNRRCASSSIVEVA